MITEIVTFTVPAGMTKEDVVARYETTAPKWAANADLIRKNYLFDGETRTAGGVYLWKERAHAERWHGPEFKKMIREVWGSEPTMVYFDTPIVVDNAAGKLVRE